MVKWPKLRSCSCGGGLAGDERLGADDEAEVAEAHHPAPRGHRRRGSRRVPLSAQPPAIRTTPTGSRGAHRPWSVRRPSGTAANSGQQRVDAGDDADRPLVGAQREGPVGDGGPGHRHRPLREGEGDDEAQQPAAVPAGPQCVHRSSGATQVR